MEAWSIRAVAGVRLPPYVEFLWCGATGPVAQYACSESLIHCVVDLLVRTVVTVDGSIALRSPLRKKAFAEGKHITLVRNGSMMSINNKGR